MKGGEREPHVPGEAQPLWRRLAWFVGLWLAGVLVLASVGFLIRMVLHT